MRPSRSILRTLFADRVYRFAGAVVAAATVAAVVAALHGVFAPLAHPSPAFVAFVLLNCALEVVPIRLPGFLDDMRFGGGTMIAFCSLVLFGTGAGVVAFASAAAFNDLVVRRSQPIKAAFNIAQFVLTMLAAGFVLHLDSEIRPGAGTIELEFMPALVAAGATMLIVNNGLSLRVTALAKGVSFRANLYDGLPAILLDAALLAFSPIVVVIAGFGAGLLPLLALPFAALYWSGRQADRRRHDALHDGLTGLPNRGLFSTRLCHELERSRRTGARLDVLLLDLDGFKEVNDALGHAYGDEVLRRVAERLSGALRPDDVVARLGGDEFGVIVGGLGGECELRAMAVRLRATLSEPLLLGGLRVRPGASIGVACWPDHGDEGPALLRHADVAMYAAKGDRTGFALYDPERDPYSPERLELLGELREGIPRGELVLHFQPKLDMRSGRIDGVEALVRWQHPQRGLLSPNVFIELAEQSDLMGALTYRVLHDAVTQAARWRDAGLDLSVAVNLSPDVLLDEELPVTVERALAERALSPDRLRLEITESTLMRDALRAAKVLERFRALGVRVSIDDFGTGYSSLAWLKRLPVHEIKIDRSFITDLDQDSSDAAIVQSTVQLGQTLGLTVVAEGVETEAALDRLEAFGCDVAQGFLISRPLPAGDLAAWLADRRAAHHLRAA